MGISQDMKRSQDLKKEPKEVIYSNLPQSPSRMSIHKEHRAPEFRLFDDAVERHDVLVHCGKVFAAKSEFGDGAYAMVDIAKGEIVEHGLATPFHPGNVDGNAWDLVFTWQENNKEYPASTPGNREWGKEQQWATCSGIAFLYNTVRESPNTEMYRDYVQNTFVIVANRDIKAGQALTHTYESMNWRKIFVDCLPPAGVPDHDFETREVCKGNVSCENIVVKCDNQNPAWVRSALAGDSWPEGHIIETGVFRALPGPYDGKDNLSKDTALWRIHTPKNMELWASLSGQAMFLKHDYTGENVNTRFEYDYVIEKDADGNIKPIEGGTFKLIATRAITKGDVLSVYRRTRDKFTLPANEFGLAESEM